MPGWDGAWGSVDDAPAGVDEIEHEPETRGVPLRTLDTWFAEDSVTPTAGPPLAPPLRHITSERGHWGAVRYNSPDGKSSSGRPFYKGQKPRGKPHQGVDLRSTPGEYVLAVGAGQVVPANAGVGGKVVVLILDGTQHRIVYADLARVLVKPGDRVKLGQPVAVAARFVHVGIHPFGSAEPMNPHGWIPYAEDNA